ncbi:phenylalanine--tRNA ligase subunit alpha [Patescibacteria group bacterium]
MALKFNVKLFKNKAENSIEKSKDLKGLNDVFKEYLGKEGKIAVVLNSLEKLSKEKRAKTGKEVNEFKVFFKKVFEKKKSSFIKTVENKEDWIDVTVPGKKQSLGHLHPLTLTRRKVEEIFQVMGFSVIEGPEIETEWYNFDALNIPKNHPARDLWDTLWLKQKIKNKKLSEKLLLRTHTSPVQVRYMEKHNPPLRIIVPGNVYRHEATDASHEFQLCQVEGLMVDKEISVSNFLAIIEEFFKRFFGKKVKVRLRPDFFPFVEPGFDVSISCLVCTGKGCPVCKLTGWVEMAGAGMVHPNVLKNSGLNPKFWQGWAFGFGLDRLTMMKYKIDDIRLFRLGDLKFLEQF